MQRHSTFLRKDEINTIAIGGFDGIHRAHQQLVKCLGNKGALLVIDRDHANLTPNIKRGEYSKHPCMFYHFLKVKDLSGEEFIKLVKKDFPNLKKIVVGYDFQFGKNRSCVAKDLHTLFDGETVIVSEFLFDGISVHSSTIREFIKNGNITQANRLLGREFAIVGRVIKGQGLGKKELYPTLNLNVKQYLLPKDGVYATRTKIGDSYYNSVSFIGTRVSTDNEFSVETHIIDEDTLPNFEDVEIFFVEYLRENKKFTDMSELKAQISKDIEISRDILKSCILHIGECSVVYDYLED